MKVNLFFHDNAYSPSDHPHAPAGSAKGGQFVRKESGFSFASPAAGKNAVIKKLHMIVTGPGGEHAKADKLKEIASQQKAPIVASYANKLLAELEQQHGYESGSLGKAVPKSDGGEAPAKTEPKPAKIAVPKPPTTGKKLTTSKKYNKQAYTIATTSSLSTEEKLNQLQQLGTYWTGSFFQSYLGDLVKVLGGTLGQTEAAKPAAAKYVPEPDLPKPYEGSAPQKALYDAAANASTKAEQIAAVQAVSASGTMSTKYKTELLKALGHTDTPATPATPAADPKKLTSVRLADQKLLDKFKSAATGESAASAIPTFHTTAFKATFSSEQQSAMKAYTGSGYAPINAALRKPKEADASAVKFVNLIDDAFEEDAARLTNDIVVKRGLSALANTAEQSQAALENIKAGLKAGLPVKFSQRGFISTSIGGGFSANIKMKILLRKGTPAIYVGAISSHESEKELLLRHGQQFRVVEYNEMGAGHHELTMVAEI